tara:strand:+ start:36 stop:824 length:789 start_codon:yes stop_codon:yes gene_type:complete
MIEHLVYYSGGVGSWASAKRLAQNPKIKSLTLLFADTLIEDEDLYRFLDESVENLRQEDCDINYVKITEGRTPWEVFEDVKFIGNSRIDPCSRVLKREFMDRWRDEHCDPAYTTMYYGIDWTEIHRLERVRKRVGDWKIDAPMTHEPFMDKSDMLQWLQDEGIEPPRLYKMGFPHNNCGGFCVKAGQAQFKLLLQNMPERYAHHEKMENEVAKKIGTDARILRDRRNKQVRPLSLTEFRERVQEQPAMFDKFDFGGCGCALD